MYIICVYMYVTVNLSARALSIIDGCPCPGDVRIRPMDFARCQSPRASPLTPLVEGLLGITRMTIPGEVVDL